MFLVSLNVRKTENSAGSTTYGTFLVVVLSSRLNRRLQRLYGARDFSPFTPRQSTNFQIAKPDFVTMILQQEARLSLGAEPRNIFVFALGDSINQCRASQIVFDDFGSVKPMFDVFALNDDS